MRTPPDDRIDGSREAAITANSRIWRRLRRRPPPPSLPGRRERRDSRKMAERRKRREEARDFPGVCPQIGGSQVGWMRRTVKEMDN